MMSANTIIHTIDVSKNECIVTLHDDGDIILDKVNIGIDVAGNTTYIYTTLKEHLNFYRRNKTREDLRVI
tara:strand:+ start:687 stop:896 length:210 start_codon:yes stop_codon:yes gene_type:complete